MEITLERLPPPATGSLKLDVTPAEAALTLDGTEMGSATDFREELAAGTHVVEISAAGYQSRRETVTIAAGAEQYMEIVLGGVSAASLDRHSGARRGDPRRGPDARR